MKNQGFNTLMHERKFMREKFLKVTLPKKDHDLFDAVNANHVNQVSELLVKIDNIDNIIFHLAIENGHTEIVKILIKYGADINSSNLEGRSAIQSALDNSMVDIANLLIEAGIDLTRVNIKDTFTSKSIKLIETLLNKGIRIHSEDIIEYFAISSIKSADKEGKVLSLLLNHAEASILTDKMLYDALHHAVGIKNLNLLKLIELKASDKQLNIFNHSSLFTKAILSQNFDAVDLLLSYGMDADEYIDFIIRYITPDNLQSLKPILESMLIHSHWPGSLLDKLILATSALDSGGGKYINQIIYIVNAYAIYRHPKGERKVKPEDTEKTFNLVEKLISKNGLYKPLYKFKAGINSMPDCKFKFKLLESITKEEELLESIDSVILKAKGYTEEHTLSFIEAGVHGDGNIKGIGSEEDWKNDKTFQFFQKNPWYKQKGYATEKFFENLTDEQFMLIYKLNPYIFEDLKEIKMLTEQAKENAAKAIAKYHEYLAKEVSGELKFEALGIDSSKAEKVENVKDEVGENGKEEITEENNILLSNMNSTLVSNTTDDPLLEIGIAESLNALNFERSVTGEGIE